jgi:hypothetical protein
MNRARKPISRLRINRLIYVSIPRLHTPYILHTGGFDGNAAQIRFSVFAHARDEARWLRERAYDKPWLFPHSALKLHEWAKIHAHRRTSLEAHHQQSLQE